MLSIFSCAFWLVCLIWKEVFSDLLFFDWVVYLFWYWAAWVFCKFWRLIPCQSHHLLTFFFPFCVLSFHFVCVFLCCGNLLSLMRSHLFIFGFISITVKDRLKKNHCYLCQSGFCLCFILRGFSVSSFTFRSLIHLEFIFCCGVRACYNFFLSQVAVQFSQQSY